MNLLLDLALVAWLIVLAIHVARTGDDRNAIIAFIAFGLLLGLAWTRLGAIDVALTEAAIGGGITGLLLLRAEAHLRRGRQAGSARRRSNAATTIVAALASAAVALGLGVAVLAFPSPAPTLAPPALAAIDATGLGNPVTAVLLAYRALDTLLEKVVVLLALLGVWALTPDHLWGGAPALKEANPPQPLLYLARTLPPFGVLIAVYMVWVGADAPGGTFQAGSILAAMWLLVMLAGLSPAPETRSRLLRLLLVGGPALFFAIGFLGFAVAGDFLAYPEPLAKALIVGIEAALTIAIALALGLLVAGPSSRAPAP